MSRTLPLILVLICSLAATACGTGHVDTVAGRTDSAAFSLSVLPETYSFGGSAASIALSQQPAADGVDVQISARGAQQLRALYLSVNYDPTRFSPAGESGNGIAAPEQRLTLTLSDVPGTLTHGEVLLHPQSGSGRGYSGSGTLLTLHFARRPFGALRSASTPPSSDASRCNLLSDGAGGFVWNYYNPGDYDQNGVVAVQDLTPIGINFGAAVPESSPGVGDAKTALDVIDGSRDRVINVQDLTAIGINFGNKVQSFNLYEAPDASAYPLANTDASTIPAAASIDFSASVTDTTQFRRDFLYTPPVALTGPAFWVRPVDSSGVEGTPSTALGGPNGAPVINNLYAFPSPALPGTEVELYADVSDPENDLLIYTWTPVLGSGALQAPTPDVGAAGFDLYLGAPTVAETVELMLTADDQHGNVVSQNLSFDFSVAATESWHVTQVDHGSDTNTGARSSLVSVYGRPEIYYFNQSASLGDGVFMATPYALLGENWRLRGKIGDGGYLGMSAVAMDARTGVAVYDDAGGLNVLNFYYRPDATSVAHNSFTLDATPLAGEHVSGMLDSLGQPFFSYHTLLDVSSGSLRTEDGLDWTADSWSAPVPVAGEPATPGVDVGGYSSVALIGGLPAVAYYDGVNKQLMYAGAADAAGTNWTNPAPTLVYAQPPSDIGLYPQLVEVVGFPAVFFCDQSSGSLLYKRADNAGGTSWSSIPTGINTGDVDMSSGISAAIMPSGDPFVVYSVLSTGILWNFEGTAVDCSTGNYEIVDDSSGLVFKNPSCALIGGHAAVSYYDSTNEDLKYAIKY